MTETAMRELAEAAPAAFVNGDATHRQPHARGSRRVAKGAARHDPTRHELGDPPAAVGAGMAWPETLDTVLRVHEAWRDGVTTMAREQLALVADTGSSLATTGRALMAEPEPARRMELVWAQALLQLERSLEVSTRLMEIIGSTGQGLLDAAAAGRHRPG